MTKGISREDSAELLAKAEQKLASARHSLAGGFYDDAASRAYYAVFHAISAVLASNGEVFSSHKQTLSAFNKEFIAAGKTDRFRFKDIQRLFNDRQNGDYDTMIAVERETAEEDLRIAANIVEVCKEYLKV
ncbi:MAG: HEPN domain-containing protein [Lentisphaerae bacterium]|nr:HEPN domain-containing protein [Lentisphaerota bacterium]